MSRRITACAATLAALASMSVQMHAAAPKIDYSVVEVGEEHGLELTKITSESDYVCMPQVKRSTKGIDWFTNKIIAMVPGSDNMAYLSVRNNTTNIFIKDLSKQGSSRQRTNRTAVIDFSFSPDGKDLYFSEARAKTNQIFRTDAQNGYVCRQITSGASDYSPVVTPDGKQVFFARVETRGAGLWSYNLESNFLSSYSSGQNPAPIVDETALMVVRLTPEGRTELWKINYETGDEECIVSDPVRSFSTPSISPDGRWILFVGSSMLDGGTFTYPNTDIYVCRLDGTDMRQLTHHAADDLSPTWSGDGRYIYFISQRGDANGTANIWRMTFTE
jgi:Tol biopolymer transport system component